MRHLTSFELVGDPGNPTELNQHTFLPFISGSPSVVSLSLSHFTIPYHAPSSQVTPVKLPELKSLRLIGTNDLSDFPSLIDVPGLKTLSSFQISTRRMGSLSPGFLVRAESGDGFHLLYDAPNDAEVSLDWFGVEHNANPGPSFVRFEGWGPS